MTPEQFTYWLQGFMEVADPNKLDEKQTQIIKDHLALVFDKQTPDRTSGLFNPSIPFPTPPFQGSPDWTYRPPYTVICSTDSYSDFEDPMTKKFCNTTEIFNSYMVPQDMFGKKEEDIVGTDSFLVGEGNISLKPVIKSSLKNSDKDNKLPKGIRKGIIGKGGLKC